MKKLYFLAAAALLSLGAYAQTNVKIAYPKKQVNAVKKTNKSAMKGGLHSTSALAGGLYSLNNYVAGTTMDLNFVLELSNADSEYGDSLAITLPTGFTINSVTPNDSIGVAEDPDPASSGCPDANSGTKEPYNGIFGQTISWGNNDNCYGGISTTQFDGSFTITINVTIDANVTGFQTGDLFVSGDMYANPADLATTFTIKPVENKSVTNLFSGLITLSNGASLCGLTSDYLAYFIKNTGLDTVYVGTPGDSVEYSVNGVTTRDAASLVLDLAGQSMLTFLAPGDTGVILVTTPIDLSSVGTTYTINSSIDFAGTGDADNSDDAGATFTVTNLTPNALAAQYATTFGTAGTALPAGWATEDYDGSGSTFSIFNNTTVGTTGNSLMAYEGNTPTVSNDWAYTTCFDLKAGFDYRLEYKVRVLSDMGYVGAMAIAYGTAQDSTAMLNVISPMTDYSANTTYTTFVDTFMIANAGVYHIGFNAVNEDPAGAIALLLDDVRLREVGPTSVKSLTSTSVKVYPNPNNGVFTVTTPVASNMEVINVLGSVVYTSKVNAGNNNVNLNGLTAGTYFVKVNNQVTRVIVK